MPARLDFDVTRGITKTLPLRLIGCRADRTGCARGALRLRGYSLELELIRGGLSREAVDCLTTEDGRAKVSRDVVILKFDGSKTAAYPRHSMPYRLKAIYEKGTRFETSCIVLVGEIRIKG